jgi:hypothetical protein
MKKTVEDLVDKLIVSNQQQIAIEILMAEYKSAKSSGDTLELDSILAHLVFAHTSRNPPDIEEARQLCIEREQNIDSAYNLFQTGMFFYHSANDYSEAIKKLQEAIATGKRERDTRTVYSSLSTLGLALIRNGQDQEAADALREIEQSIADKHSLVVGDETAFLELAFDHGLEIDRIKRIASVLAPVCRDPQFARRLSILADKS